MPTKEITPKSTMQEILDAYPAAKQMLFDRYHIGGCSSCGFEPTDTLEAVLKGKGFSDGAEAIEQLKKSQKESEKLQIDSKELSALLKDSKVKLIDVRTPEEHATAHIEGDQLASQELVDEILEKWAKDTPIVLYCHVGQRSLGAATHLSKQGFSNVKSLNGGIEAWSQEVDPNILRY